MISKPKKVRAGTSVIVFSMLFAASCTTAQVDPAPASVSTASERPNILFIQIDDLRPDLGIYGHPLAQTPNIDALGKAGLVFENAITQQAVCGPARAALMTGIRPSTSGITDLKSPIDEALPYAVTLLDLFKANGYATLGYGKIYHHHVDDKDGWTKRTDDFEGEHRRHIRQHNLPNLAADIVEDRSTLPDVKNVAMALEDMKALGKSGEQFLMAVGLHRPHLPFIAPASDWARYDRNTLAPPVNPEGQNGAPPWAVVAWEIWNYDDMRSYEKAGKVPDEQAWKLRHGYLAAISFVDSLVGELVAGLEANGLADNTIIVLWSDHGWKFGDQGGWAKHSNVDLDIRIPMMIYAPGKTKAETRSAAMVESVDIYPTLAELAGLTTPETVEGTSMVPLFAQPDRPWKRAAFAQYHRSAPGLGRLDGETVRDQRFRYTAWVDSKGSVREAELYDLRNDPTESTNVAKMAEYADALAIMENVRKGGWRAATP